jgi:hypothetical protein
MKIWAIQQLAQARFDVCKGCDKLTTTFKCMECGCYMKLKVKLNNSTCPLNKWTELVNKT